MSKGTAPIVEAAGLLPDGLGRANGTHTGAVSGTSRRHTPPSCLGGGEMQTMANHMYAVGSSEARRAFILVLLSVFV